MILKGTQRASATALVRHLLNDHDNDHVSVHEISGFVSDTLAEALKEAEAISRSTRCTQHLYSVSFNPPETADVPIEMFLDAIAKVEEAVNLKGQPRAVVIHEKNGRRHAHCVWSRIDVDAMRAINLPYSKMRLQDISRQLFQQHNWPVPSGLIDKSQTNPLNMERQEFQQSQRLGRDPVRLKATLRQCWETSDNANSFGQSVLRQGFALARGERRGFVLINADGEVLSLSRWLDLKSKELGAKLGDPADVPSTAEAQRILAQEVSVGPDHWLRELKARYASDISRLDGEVEALKVSQREERKVLMEKQQERHRDSAAKFRALMRGGMLGLWDRATGRRKRVERLAWLNVQVLANRDNEETHSMIQRHLGARRHVQQQKNLLRNRIESEVAERIRLACQSLEEREHSLQLVHKHFGPEFGI